MRSKTLIPSLILCALASLGCNAAKRLTAFRVERIDAVEASAIDGSGFTITVRCQVRNPNPLSATIKNLKVRAMLGQHRLGEGSKPGVIEVKANSTFPLTLPMRVRYADLPADLPKRLAGGTLDLTSKVLFFVKSRWGEHPLQLTVKSKTKVAQAMAVALRGSFAGPALKIRSVKLGGLRLRKVWLRLGIEATNLFKFPIRIQRAVTKLSINGSHFGDGRLDKALPLGPGATVKADVDVIATHGAVGRAIGAMLGSGPKFQVKGTIWIDPIGGVTAIPFALTADSSVFGNQRFIRKPSPSSRGQSILPK